MTTGDLVGTEFCYHTIPEQLDPYDNEAFLRSKTPFYLVCTKYPKFVKRLEGRPEEYNQTVEEITKLEEEGKCFVIRPKRPLEIGRMTHDVKEIIRTYERGRSDAFECMEQMKAWMKEEE